MKILSIGNSFSQDAQRYLSRLAAAGGESFKCMNLYIGGCTLATHYNNMAKNNRDYELELNGESTGEKISIKEALESDSWDVVTLQQASRYSVDIDSYFPYIQSLYDYVRERCTGARILLHETWEYEKGFPNLQSIGYEDPSDMYRDLHLAYTKAGEKLCADGIIPCGTAMHLAINDGLRAHRDMFHASRGAGRYLLALTWYATLTGKDISENLVCDFDEPVGDDELKIVRSAVQRALGRK